MGTGYGDEQGYEGCIYDTVPCDHCNNCGKYKICACCENEFHYINGDEFTREIAEGKQKIWVCHGCIDVRGYF